MQFTVRETMNQQLLCLRFHLHEGFRRQLFGQKPEQQRELFFLYSVENRGNVRRIHGDQHITDCGIPLLLKKLSKRTLYCYGMCSHKTLPPFYPEYLNKNILKTRRFFQSF